MQPGIWVLLENGPKTLGLVLLLKLVISDSIYIIKVPPSLPPALLMTELQHCLICCNSLLRQYFIGPSCSKSISNVFSVPTIHVNIQRETGKGQNGCRPREGTAVYSRVLGTAHVMSGGGYRVGFGQHSRRRWN